MFDLFLKAASGLYYLCVREIMPNNIVKKRILTYDDIVTAPAGDSSEPLIDVQTYSGEIVARYDKHDMEKYTGEVILVRDAVAKKLADIQGSLYNQYGLRLKVVYGYRHPDIQMSYFETRKLRLGTENPNLSDSELDRLTHNFVAVPSVAGHPTGGAVDLTIVDTYGNELDMGNKIADYANPELIKTFARVNSEQAKNRQLLHDLMIEQDFAPFYGEWWHFSYGDREWAAFYNRKALYGAVDFRTK